MSTLFGTAIIRGVEFDVFSECEIHWQDDSFDHEFGTEVCGHAEIQTIDLVQVDNDISECAMQELRDKCRPHRRRKFLKWIRHIRRELNALDVEKFWTDNQKQKVESKWEPPEPDYE
jgi:hypothetical protein